MTHFFRSFTLAASRPFLALLRLFRRSLRALEVEQQLQTIRARAEACGPGLSVKGLGTFTGLGRLTLGENVHIGNRAFIRAEGGLTIGDNTHISRNVTIYTMSHEYEGSLLPYDSGSRLRAVSIGRNVWIGMNVIVLPGAQIPDGAIIGAGSVVAGAFNELGIYVAPVASRRSSRSREHYSALDRAGRYGAANGRPYRAGENA